MSNYHFISFDIETTGLGARAGIVELAAVCCHSARSFHARVKTDAPMSAAAQATHGISAADLVDCPRLAAVWPQFVAWVDGCVEERGAAGSGAQVVIAAYNGKAFDFRTTAYDLARCGLAWPAAWRYCDPYCHLLGRKGFPLIFPSAGLAEARKLTRLHEHLFGEGALCAPCVASRGGAGAGACARPRHARRLQYLRRPPTPAAVAAAEFDGAHSALADTIALRRVIAYAIHTGGVHDPSAPARSYTFVASVLEDDLRHYRHADAAAAPAAAAAAAGAAAVSHSGAASDSGSGSSGSGGSASSTWLPRILDFDEVIDARTLARFVAAHAAHASGASVEADAGDDVDDDEEGDEQEAAGAAAAPAPARRAARSLAAPTAVAAVGGAAAAPSAPGAASAASASGAAAAAASEVDALAATLARTAISTQRPPATAGAAAAVAAVATRASARAPAKAADASGLPDSATVTSIRGVGPKAEARLLELAGIVTVGDLRAWLATLVPAAATGTGGAGARAALVAAVTRQLALPALDPAYVDNICSALV